MAKTTKLVGYGISFDMELVGGVKTADDFRKAAKSVQKSLNASENAVRQYEIKQEQLNQALQKGAITKKQYDQAMTTLAFREQRRVERLEKERRAVLGLDKQESILAKNRQNRARMAGMAAAGVSELGLGGRAAGAARFLGGAAGLGGAATGLGLGFAGIAVIQQSVKAFADLEAKVAGLKSLFGESLGEPLTNQFRNLAKTTILTNNQLIENAKTWASYGLTTDGLTDRLKRLGTVAGGNSEKFRSLTIAFAQVNAQGKLMGQEKNQLINAGFSLQAVADAAGISMENFADAMKNGEITAEHLNEALIKVTSEGGLFAGYLEKQAETINGKMTILTSTWEEFLQTLGEAERGPAGFFLDKMILAAETLKTSAEYFSGKNIFPFSTPAGKAIPGSSALGAAGSQAQVDVGGLPEGFGLLDILSFMGINSRMLGLKPTGPYATGESVDAPSGFRALPSIDPTIAKNVQEANDALKEQDVIQGKLNEQFKRYMENVMLAESGRRARTGSVAISQYEQQELINEAKRIAETFGDAARMTFQKVFPEVFDKEFSDKFVGPMEKSAFDRAKEESEQNDARRRQMDTLYNMEVEAAEKKRRKEFELLEQQFKERERTVAESLAIEKKLAQGPSQRDAMFTGGSVEEFMFLRRQTQENETARAVKEAEEKAARQREQIEADRKAAQEDMKSFLTDLVTNQLPQQMDKPGN
jgi:tape measure domain-containing protein